MKSWIRTFALVVALGWVGNATAHDSPKAPQEVLDVAVLSPRDGIAVNAATLEIQALVAARRAGRSDDDVWRGWLRVDLAIDGELVETLDPTVCRGQIVAGFRTSLTDLEPGAHVATVTASKKTRGHTVRESKSFNFVIDPTLPVAETNRVEDAATPKPFACLSTPDYDPDDDDRADDFDSRFGTLRGSFVPNALSQGLDLANDRVVLALDEQFVVIEPGEFACRAPNRCRFTGNRGSLVRSVRLEQKRNGRWTFTIATRHRLSSPRSLFLRVGANWGGLDYVNDRYLASLALSLDQEHRATETIGSAGGTVQTTDAAGVVITLVVPEGALTADTPIAVTPLVSSPLVGSEGTIHPGVNLEPDGLQFAQAATLTFDFSNTQTVVTEADAIFLMTSPLTALPLPGAVDPAAATLTAEIHHFSSPQPGPGSAPRIDPAWVNRVLAQGNLSLTELRSVWTVVAALQRLGRDRTLNMSLLTQRTQQTFDTTAAASCQSDVDNPSEQALARWIDLETFGQSLGADTTSVHNCVARILQAQIVADAARARATLASADFQRLQTLASTAQLLGFDNLRLLALQGLDSALRALLAQGQQYCEAGNTVTGRNVLNRGLSWAPALSPVGLDPTLAGDLQTAINQCGAGGELTVVITPFTHAEAYGDANPHQTSLAGNSALPVSLSASNSGDPTRDPYIFGHISWTLSQPNPAEMAWDVSASGFTSAGAMAWVVPSAKGVLRIQVHGSWGAPLGPYMWVRDLATQATLINGPGTVQLAAEAGVGRSLWFEMGTPAPHGPAGGSGRLMTITFTPTP